MNEPKPDFSNKSYLLPYVNREGRRFGIPTLVAASVLVAAAVACAALVAVQGGGMQHHALFTWLAAALSFLAAPFLLLAYGVFLFFRDPERYPPEDEAAILSPADGRVCMVKECPLPAELIDALPEGIPPQTLHTRVSVFMSVFNVHVNRMPTAAKILKMAHVPGKFLNASLDKASTDNERCCYLMQAPCGTVYGVVQIAGLVAKRIVPFVSDGADLARAERFGLIRFGSRLDVYLPAGARAEVREGQTMVAGETVLGRLPGGTRNVEAK
jgi:phosphatidylserine decarboxylase